MKTFSWITLFMLVWGICAATDNKDVNCDIMAFRHRAHMALWERAQKDGSQDGAALWNKLSLSGSDESSPIAVLLLCLDPREFTTDQIKDIYGPLAHESCVDDMEEEDRRWVHMFHEGVETHDDEMIARAASILIETNCKQISQFTIMNGNLIGSEQYMEYLP